MQHDDLSTWHETRGELGPFAEVDGLGDELGAGNAFEEVGGGDEDMIGEPPRRVAQLGLERIAPARRGAVEARAHRARQRELPAPDVAAPEMEHDPLSRLSQDRNVPVRREQRLAIVEVKDVVPVKQPGQLDALSHLPPRRRQVVEVEEDVLGVSEGMALGREHVAFVTESPERPGEHVRLPGDVRWCVKDPHSLKVPPAAPGGRDGAHETEGAAFPGIFQIPSTPLPWIA